MQIAALDRARAVLDAHDLIEQLASRRMAQSRGVRLDQNRRGGRRQTWMNRHGADMGIAGAEAQNANRFFRASAGEPIMTICTELS
jgi:hypothetical protein